MIAGTQAEYHSDADSTKDTPNLVLMGKLWGVVCEYFLENWPSYNGTTLCVDSWYPIFVICYMFSFFEAQKCHCVSSGIK